MIASTSICGATPGPTRDRASSGAEPADDRGKPASCPAEGRPVVRSPENLTLHRALAAEHRVDMGEGRSQATGSKDRPAAEPILITTSGTILAGFGRWRLAV